MILKKIKIKGFFQHKIFICVLCILMLVSNVTFCSHGQPYVGKVAQAKEVKEATDSAGKTTTKEENEKEEDEDTGAESWIEEDAKDDIYNAYDDEHEAFQEWLEEEINGEDTKSWIDYAKDFGAFGINNILGGVPKLASYVLDFTGSSITDMLVNLLGDINKYIFSALVEAGMSLTSIICGRVGSNGIEVDGTVISPWTFELAEGNPYGIVALAVYNTLRNIFMVVTVCAALVFLIMLLFSGNRGNVLRKAKESLQPCLVFFVILMLLPNLVDTAIYIRDVILFAMNTSTADVLGFSRAITTFDGELGFIFMDISYTFYLIAEEEPGFVNQLMFGAANIVTIYYAIKYVELALSMTAHVISFPIVGTVALFDRDIMKTYVKTFFAYLFTPIIDAALMWIPAMFGIMGDHTVLKIIQLIACITLMASRKKIMGMIGNGGVSGELGGLATILGAGRMAASLVTNTAGAVQNGVEGMKKSYDSEMMSNYYSEMAESVAQMRGENGRYNSAFSFGGEYAFGENTDNGEANIDGNIPAMEKNSTDSTDGTAGDSSVEDNSNVSMNAFGLDGAGFAMNMSQEQINQSILSQNPEILGKYANKDNFDKMPEFRNLSNERRAELYRQRASAQRRAAIAGTYGQLGLAAAGGVAGVTAGLFGGPTTTTFLSAAGMNAGGRLGYVLGQAGGNLFVSDSAIGQQFVSGGGENLHSEDESEKDSPINVNVGDVQATTQGEAGAEPEVILGGAENVQQVPVSNEKMASSMSLMETISKSMLNYNNNSTREILDNNYKGGNVSYEEFRENVSCKIKDEMEKNLSNSPIQFSSPEETQQKIEQHAHNIYTASLNPKDDGGNQKTLSPDSFLSKESLAVHGYVFDVSNVDN